MYPLAVEQPVLNQVGLLVPGVTTLTTIARYFSFYWALADVAATHDLDAAASRTLVRNAEVALAWASALQPEGDELTGTQKMHGADTVNRLLQKGQDQHLADVGPGTYSPRSWGYWSQYRGSALTLKIAAADGHAIRRGSRSCPDSIKQMYEGLLSMAAARAPRASDVAAFFDLTVMGEMSPDVEPLRELLCATDSGVHSADNWLPADRMRRSTLRILGRSAQVCSNSKGWRFTLADGVAYGGHIDSDPVFVSERRQAQTWRGMLLRHHSVGAWRALWSALVDEVIRTADPVSRDQLHEWIRGQVGNGTVDSFVDGLPPVQANGHPAAAEETVGQQYTGVEASIGILLLGGLRLDHLDGEVLASYLGGSARRRVYLDPHWVRGQHTEYESRSLGDLACALVDDMLAQSHRVSLRKMRVENNGQMILPTKLHEREGRWFAESREGAGNIGVRAYQLGQICTQLGMFIETDGAPMPTAIGCALLGLPE
ncbi:hypothetical protein [Mycobacterium sp. DBP42]|uniref:hypothetical protein n=1 Tax=Mycobacterium sp. DBP42 TaxID=2545267 RepID=UPI00110D1133|nr:hypothetical protein [Mycobacterium sp. DBP42]TMS54785.1 hypothetical protein E0T84_04280 [Mycobacterium sp. DBP42]